MQPLLTGWFFSIEPRELKTLTCPYILRPRLQRPGTGKRFSRLRGDISARSGATLWMCATVFGMEKGIYLDSWATFSAMWMDGEGGAIGNYGNPLKLSSRVQQSSSPGFNVYFYYNHNQSFQREINAVHEAASISLPKCQRRKKRGLKRAEFCQCSPPRLSEWNLDPLSTVRVHCTAGPSRLALNQNDRH